MSCRTPPSHLCLPLPPLLLPLLLPSQSRLQHKACELQGLSGREEELKERLNDLNAFIEVGSTLFSTPVRCREQHVNFVPLTSSASTYHLVCCSPDPPRPAPSRPPTHPHTHP